MAFMKREAGGTVVTDMGFAITFVPSEKTYVPDLPEVITACRAAGAVDYVEPAEPAAAEAKIAKAKTAKAE